jgi:hypothetical protein
VKWFRNALVPPYVVRSGRGVRPAKEPMLITIPFLSAHTLAWSKVRGENRHVLLFEQGRKDSLRNSQCTEDVDIDDILNILHGGFEEGFWVGV